MIAKLVNEIVAYNSSDALLIPHMGDVVEYFNRRSHYGECIVGLTKFHLFLFSAKLQKHTMVKRRTIMKIFLSRKWTFELGSNCRTKRFVSSNALNVQDIVQQVSAFGYFLIRNSKFGYWFLLYGTPDKQKYLIDGKQIENQFLVLSRPPWNRKFSVW